MDPKRRAARRDYYRKWRKNNQKLFGKTRPTVRERTKAVALLVKQRKAA